MNFINLKGNKKGSAYWFIYILAFAFVIGILFLIFDQTLQVYIYPTSQFLTNESCAIYNTTGCGTPQMEEVDNWIGYWKMVPILFVFIMLIFMFYKLTSRDSVE